MDGIKVISFVPAYALTSPPPTVESISLGTPTGSPRIPVVITDVLPVPPIPKMPVKFTLFIEPLHHGGQTSAHDLHGFIFVLSAQKSRQVATPGLRHLCARNIRRERGFSHDAKIYDLGFQAGALNQFFDKGILAALCV